MTSVHSRQYKVGRWEHSRAWWVCKGKARQGSWRLKAARADRCDLSQDGRPARHDESGTDNVAVIRPRLSTHHAWRSAGWGWGWALGGRRQNVVPNQAACLDTRGRSCGTGELSSCVCLGTARASKRLCLYEPYPGEELGCEQRHPCPMPDSRQRCLATRALSPPLSQRGKREAREGAPSCAPTHLTCDGWRAQHRSLHARANLAALARLLHMIQTSSCFRLGQVTAVVL